MAVHAPVHVCLRELLLTLEEGSIVAELRCKDGALVSTMSTMASILNSMEQYYKVMLFTVTL